VIVIALGGVGYLLVRDTVQNFRNTIDSFERLEKEYGRVQDYIPSSTGIVDERRLETFTIVREELATARKEMETAVQALTDRVDEIEDGSAGFWRILGVVGKGMGALPQMAEYFKTRNEILIDRGMGLGEYFYLYTVVYYSWLQKSPGDGPPFRLMSGDDGGYYRFDREDEEESDSRYGDDYIDQRRKEVSRLVNRMATVMIQKQADYLSDSARPVWQPRLERELEKLKNDPERIPWQDGLPTLTRRSLEPYRERLEAVYSFLLNPLELRPLDGR